MGQTANTQRRNKKCTYNNIKNESTKIHFMYLHVLSDTVVPQQEQQMSNYGIFWRDHKLHGQ